ncbi:MAG TPA: hypothetical protein VHA75_02585 [Rugosimonospora sp.]|nr:hypothetical protein [Rugosimonospora sp.]
MTTTEPDYMTTYRETWADLVETDGKLDLDKVARELHDYHFLLCEVPLAYDAVTGGRISKPNTRATAVEQCATDYSNRIQAGDLLADLLPELAHDTDRQALIDYAEELYPGAWDEYQEMLAARKAVAK